GHGWGGRRRVEGPPSQRTPAGWNCIEPLAEGRLVFHRLLSGVAALAAALVLVRAALAVNVHVRVEGKTRTIFGATSPLVDVQANALDALESASALGEFFYHVTQTSFGPYVDQIGRYAAVGQTGWVFKVDGA